MKRPYRLILAFILLFTLPALACNLPIGPAARQNAAQRTRVSPLLPVFPTGEPTGLPVVPDVETPTAAPAGQEAPPPAPSSQPPVAGQPYVYLAQPGDSLPALAERFAVDPDAITSPQLIPPQGLIPPGQPLHLVTALPAPAYPGVLLPDGEIVDGVDAADFDIAGYIQTAGGYLSTYSEQVGTEKLTGAEIIRRAAVESSTNPRLLLALLEYTSGWVTGQPKSPQTRTYPIGFYVPEYQGLSKEMSLAVRMLSQGYYGWRDGSLTSLEFIDKKQVRISPQLNAGTVAVQYLYTKLLERASWEKALYGPDGLTAAYRRLFGDPWARAAQAGPVFPAGLRQPALELPFAPGERWSLTGGPHISWGVGSPRGALDLAPVTGEPACQVSAAWARAAAPGLVVRSERNQLALDLDGDGREQTGWVLFYYHLAEKDRAPVGTRVNTGDKLGHPSCEGTRATGTHVHIARKYNGEWLPAGEPLPFVLSGWTVHPGKIPYEGTMVKGDQIVTARPDGEHDSILVR